MGYEKEQSGYLYEKLKQYSEQDWYPFHMPGHKRCGVSMGDPYQIDITEIEGFDNLHHAQGILKEAQERASALYHAKKTHFLVNGSTAGILAAIGACVAWQEMKEDPEKKDETDQTEKTVKILMARNCHKSVYHAVYQNRLEPIFLYPKPWQNGKKDMSPETAGRKNTYKSREYEINGRIEPEDVERVLSEEKVCCVVITSPTYDGVVSDVKQIAEIAHAYKVPLVVDEAHGAHFGLHSYFPPSALSLGVDLVICSLHKTLPALTQTALLQEGQECRLPSFLVDRMCGIYQTSSPSYVLMASMDECIRICKEEGPERFEVFAERLEGFYRRCGGRLKNLELIRTDDPSRILVGTGTSGLSGNEICAILRSGYHLEPEMTSIFYVLLLTSAWDDETGFLRLEEALYEMDRMCETEKTIVLGQEISGQDKEQATGQEMPDEDKKEQATRREIHRDQESHGQTCRGARKERAEHVLPLQKAWDTPGERILLAGAAGRISGEFVWLYPPGVPILVPGERIEGSVLSNLLVWKQMGYSLQGMEDDTADTIRVVCKKED